MKIKMKKTSLDVWNAWRGGEASGELDDMILDTLYKAGADGLMCWQIEKKIDRLHQAVSGNLRHLVEKGGVVQLERRGRTPSGRGAYYWCHVDHSGQPLVRPQPTPAAEALQRDLWG